LSLDATFPKRIVGPIWFEGLSEKGYMVLKPSNIESLPGDRTIITTLVESLSIEESDEKFLAGMEMGTHDLNADLDELESELLVKD
jgi:hypothetical protein